MNKVLQTETEFQVDKALGPLAKFVSLSSAHMTSLARRVEQGLDVTLDDVVALVEKSDPVMAKAMLENGVAAVAAVVNQRQQGTVAQQAKQEEKAQTTAQTAVNATVSNKAENVATADKAEHVAEEAKKEELPQVDAAGQVFKSEESKKTFDAYQSAVDAGMARAPMAFDSEKHTKTIADMKAAGGLKLSAIELAKDFADTRNGMMSMNPNVKPFMKFGKVMAPAA